MPPVAKAAPEVADQLSKAAKPDATHKRSAQVLGAASPASPTTVPSVRPARTMFGTHSFRRSALTRHCTTPHEHHAGRTRRHKRSSCHPGSPGSIRVKRLTDCSTRHMNTISTMLAGRHCASGEHVGTLRNLSASFCARIASVSGRLRRCIARANPPVVLRSVVICHPVAHYRHAP